MIVHSKLFVCVCVSYKVPEMQVSYVKGCSFPTQMIYFAIFNSIKICCLNKTKNQTTEFSQSFMGKWGPQ